MGLIYDQADSSDLIKSLGKNLSSAKETVSDLKSASQKVRDSVDGKTLSGAAYTAGAGLFTELIIPTTNRVTTSIDQVQQDLSKYDAADGEISSEGYLDEDNLKNQLQTLKSAKSMLNLSAYSLDLLKHTTNNPAIKVILSRTVNQFKQMASKKEKQIKKVEKKIEKLHVFSSSTSGLFSTSLSELGIAMKGGTALNNTTVNADGTYSLPKGVDITLFTKNSYDYALDEILEYDTDGTIKNVDLIKLSKWLDLFSKGKLTPYEIEALKTVLLTLPGYIDKKI